MAVVELLSTRIEVVPVPGAPILVRRDGQAILVRMEMRLEVGLASVPEDFAVIAGAGARPRRALKTRN